MWSPYNTNSFIPNFNPYYNSNTPSPSSSGMNFSNQSQNNNTQQYSQYSRPQNNIIWVSGKENARSMQLQPNSTVFLLDNDSNKFYIKTTDDIGLGRLRVFTYTEEVDSPQQQQQKQQSTNQTSIDVSQYVTKQELEKMIVKLKGELSHEQPVSTTKQNSRPDPIILTK